MSAVVDINSQGFKEHDLALDTKRSVLDGIDRELARIEPDYAQNVLRLAEAYAWLTGKGHTAG